MDPPVDGPFGNVEASPSFGHPHPLSMSKSAVHLEQHPAQTSACWHAVTDRARASCRAVRLDWILPENSRAISHLVRSQKLIERQQMSCRELDPREVLATGLDA